MESPLSETLEQAFAQATKLYQERGFQRRVGFGKKPALINVDLANAWTRPGNPFTCEKIDATFADVESVGRRVDYLYSMKG
ncbi:hypothetical protein [Aromatoleum toluvorans]|uniref:hypothetical protein n=1 Tax=Aromatoleum toluvorans TaxID=92002 RepID=UPI001FE81FFF|nr:hypothetical protein [Aromatoleum toluvorans]